MSQKFKVRVTIEKEIEIELPDDMCTDENIKEWKESLWHIDGVQDIASYAASMAAHNGSGSYDGIGELGRSVSGIVTSNPDVKFDIIYEDTETEFIK